MITEIDKGIDSDGLKRTIKRTGYWHNEEATLVEIYYNIYRTFPTGRVEKISEGIDFLQDTPAEPEIPAVLNPDGSIHIPAIPATLGKTPYTEYCKQFNADGIGAAIDSFLTTLSI